VVVFMAFLLRSFEAEGFEIPTGSMAPSLMGRHKEIVCPQCGHVYAVNADSEVDSSDSGIATGIRVTSGRFDLPPRTPRPPDRTVRRDELISPMGSRSGRPSGRSIPPPRRRMG
jgi:hypothetical protein